MKGWQGRVLLAALLVLLWGAFAATQPPTRPRGEVTIAPIDRPADVGRAGFVCPPEAHVEAGVCRR